MTPASEPVPPCSSCTSAIVVGITDRAPAPGPHARSCPTDGGRLRPQRVGIGSSVRAPRRRSTLLTGLPRRSARSRRSTSSSPLSAGPLPRAIVVHDDAFWRRVAGDAPWRRAPSTGSARSCARARADPGAARGLLPRSRLGAHGRRRRRSLRGRRPARNGRRPDSPPQPTSSISAAQLAPASRRVDEDVPRP